MFNNLVKRVFGSPTERALMKYSEVVAQINALEPKMQALSDADLREQTDRFRARVAAGEPLDALLPEAFAATREAGNRTLGMRHYDVQMIGGMVLHSGKIAEMRTGEGKTLVATLPIYLNALAGKGVHLVTPNDYLSKVGVQQMGPIYHALGMTAAVIQNSAGDPNNASYLYDPAYLSNDARFQNLRPITRREAYLADITYGTNNEFGFDYLRDNMVMDTSQLSQRDLFFAIVDEVDNILIDEARTPLIISGQADEPSDLYKRFAVVVRTLKGSSPASIEADEPDGDYVVEEKDRVVYFTEEGIEKVQRTLGIEHLYSAENSELVPYLDNTLRAHALYHRDKEYIVQDGQVIIVDEFTGRLMYGRRFSEGLHQAIEAKEGVQVRRENLTMATITFQNFFRMYKKLGGMTGTAMTEAEEFEKIYNLEVVAIPTHRPMVRKDYEDLIFGTEESKFKAVVDEVKARQEEGQPVLIGTVSIDTSERLSAMLKRAGVKHQVLNAKQHEREAEIIAQAGRSGTVTIATNMAGRGVDILLGGNPDGIARENLRALGLDIVQATTEQWEAAYGEARLQTDEDRQKVLAVGGLCVIGTERHEARRIDNQLRGRAGRQGDPGESRFYLSLEDELMRRFGGDRVKGFMNMAGLGEDEAIEHRWVSNAIGQAQTRVEGYNFDIRKRVLEYDDVVNKQREVIYRQRRDLLTRENIHDDYVKMLEDQVAAAVDEFAEDAEAPDTWDLEALHQRLFTIFPVPETLTVESMKGKTLDALEESILEALNAAYAKKTADLTEDVMRRAERMVMLQSIDQHWRRHLTDLDILREGIGLVALAQRDPLVEYKREAFGMWEELQSRIGAQAARNIFRVQVNAPQPRQQPRLMNRPLMIALQPKPNPAQPVAPPQPGQPAQQAGAAQQPRRVLMVPPAVAQQLAAAAAARREQAARQNGEAARTGGEAGARPNAPKPAAQPPKAARPQNAASASPAVEVEAAPARKADKAKLGRNDPCWCGSGKKYKDCHWKADQKTTAI
jgi:preprotein translocase subunit SecA